MPHLPQALFVTCHFMTILPTKTELDNARQKNIWDFSNKILYDLCRDNFKHDQNEHILTKVLFIGRIYAAAVERRKNKNADINDDFYIGTIAPTFQQSTLDNHLANLTKNEKLTADNIQQVLETHSYLIATLKKITDLEKRSFSSKYLHFHMPNLFFIYDSRAVKTLRTFKVKISKELSFIPKLDTVDNEYANFFCRCFVLQHEIQNKYNLTLTNRQLDNLLIDIANKQESKKLNEKKTAGNMGLWQVGLTEVIEHQ